MTIDKSTPTENQILISNQNFITHSPDFIPSLEGFLEEMTPAKLYELIPMAFRPHETGGGKPFQQKIKDFIISTLEDTNNHSFLNWRLQYPDQNSRPYPDNENNVILNLIRVNSKSNLASDQALMRQIFLQGIEAGLHPLEKDITYGLTPLGLFVTHNKFSVENELNFLEFLIGLHPDSLVDYGRVEPILSLYCEDLPYDDDKRLTALIELVVKHLPPKIEVLDANLAVYQDFYDTVIIAEPNRLPLYEPSLTALKIKKEKLRLEGAVPNVAGTLFTKDSHKSTNYRI